MGNKTHIPDKPQTDKAGGGISGVPADWETGIGGKGQYGIIFLTGIAKSYHAGIQKTGKVSSRKEWKCPIPSGRESQDAAQNVYMGNKFLALRKSEVAKVAPDRAALMGKVSQEMADMKTI